MSKQQQRFTSSACGTGKHLQCGRSLRHASSWQPVCECACHYEQAQQPSQPYESTRAGWPIVDEDDPLGTTRYGAEFWPSGGVAVLVRRAGCLPWRLGVWPTSVEAQRAVDAWIADRRAERARAKGQ